MYIICVVECLVRSMDGFRVVKLDDILPHLDILITATGGCDTARNEHLFTATVEVELP